MPTFSHSGNESHPQVAASFGVDTERYDRARPRYPEGMVRRIVAESPGTDVLDVGCGTGIAARQFQGAGCRVLGVEPDARMAAAARNRGLETEVATFEGWDPAGRLFDAVVAGQSWHWVDPLQGAYKAVDVLRPGGRFAAFWHVFQLPPEVAEGFAAAYQRAVPHAPAEPPSAEQLMSGYETMFAKVADGLWETGAFTEPEEWRFDWEYHCTRDAWLDQLPTLGLLTSLPPDKVAQVLEGAGAAVDVVGGSFTMRYTTVAVTADCP